MKKTTLLLALTTWVCNLNATHHAGLWAALGLLTAVVFGAPPAQAAVTEAWVHRYSNVVSNSVDRAFKVVRDAAGDIIVTGSSYDGITGWDMLTIKYSGADGSLLWQKRSNGGGQAMAVDGSGNVVVTGRSNGANGYSDPDYYTAKYAAADGALLWEKRYNGPANGDDDARAVAVDGNGNVIVTGSSSNGTNGYGDYYTAKYAAVDGALLWEKRYNGPANFYDSASAVAVDGSGNVVVTGSSYNTNFDTDYYTAKYAAADGALLWEQRYNGPANQYDGANAVAVDGSGNVVVTGSSYFGTTGSDYYTAKYAAADGALLWEKRYSYGQATAVAVDGSGNVVVTGTSQWDYYTAKYAAADGALLWEKRVPGGNASAVSVDSSGNVVVTGLKYNANGYSDCYTVKYAAANGALLWERRYNGPANDYLQAFAVVVDGSGNVVVTGTSGNDYYTAKYAAADGALLWEQRYNGLSKSYNEARVVVVDGSGSVVVTGYSEGSGGSSDYYTAKYAAADGALLWEQRYNGAANGDDQARAMALDSNGNVVVTGSSYNTNSNQDHYTAKYAAADGALLWEKRYTNGNASAVAVDGSGNVVVTGYSSGTNGFVDYYYTAKYAAADGALLWEKCYTNGNASAVAVDGSGNVVVTGASSTTNGTSDYYTAKYGAADGALLWEQRYNGPANWSDFASAVTVDGIGNVVVTGSSNNGDEYDYDYYTAKYAATDGALLWEQRYNAGPTEGRDPAQAVAVDDSGNVVVTGYSSGTNGSVDYYTAKYAAADGALLWEQRYNGPANSHDGASAVAVDGSGNVVVTGYSYNTNFNTDYYTAKYAAADGALLWEKRYSGPANGSDDAASLALGPNGMVAVTGTSSGDYATVVYRDDVYPISISLVPTGVRLRFTGIPGRSYTIERAPAVTGPWTTINTQTAPTSGLIEYLDAPPPPGQAFYRTVQP